MRRKIFKRFIIILLVVAIFINGMPMNPVYAEENEFADGTSYCVDISGKTIAWVNMAEIA